MYADTTSTILKVESHFNEYPSLYSEEQPLFGEWNQQHQGVLSHDRSYSKSCMSGVFNFNDWINCAPAAPCNSDHISYIEFSDFDDIWGDFGLSDPNNQLNIETIPIDVKPLNMVGQLYHQDQNVQCVTLDNVSSQLPDQAARSGLLSGAVQEEIRPNGRSCKSSSLSLDEIQKYFDVPITKAAKELKVGLTVLKKRCRELNIARWPHRKIKSLTSLIHNAKEMGLRNEIAMLEEHKRMLLEIPEMELSDRTKRLRQACFKANYKKRKSLASLPHSF